MMTCPPNSTSARLLIVDDKAYNRDILIRRLSRQGYICTEAVGGRDALDYLQQRTFDLVLLDLMMPDMDGMAVLAAIRRQYSPSELPVILVSARDASESIIDALNAGANDYLVKPVDFAMALARIRSQLAMQRSERALHAALGFNQLVISATNDGIWEWRAATGHYVYSPRMAEILGYPADERDSLSDLRSFLHPTDQPAFEAAWQAHLQGETSLLQQELRIVQKTGDCRWLLCRAQAERDDQGHAIRIVGACTDLTDFRILDSLTGLPNRILLDDRLEHCERRRQRESDYHYAVSMLSIDRYSQMHDNFGRHASNTVVCQVAETLRSLTRRADMLAYLGHGQFAMVLDPAPNALSALHWAQRIEDTIAPLGREQPLPILPTLSIGIALSTQTNTGSLLRCAESALHQVQRQGGNGHALFDQKRYTSDLAELILERELRSALERGNAITPHFQPIVSIKDGQLMGFEALARWYEGERLIPPGQFIPVAERSDLILALGEQILRHSVQQLADWLHDRPKRLSISVNLSPRQFRQPDLMSKLSELLAELNLPPQCIKLEITESVLVEDAEGAERLLGSLKGLGVQLSLDDFGTGYSSLNYLHRFPFDIIKIDRSFVMPLTQDTRCDIVVESIITLAHRLSMTVVAEGVETQEQWDFLAARDCDYAQGFLIGRPQPAVEAKRWLSPEWRYRPY